MMPGTMTPDKYRLSEVIDLRPQITENRPDTDGGAARFGPIGAMDDAKTIIRCAASPGAAGRAPARQTAA